MELPDPSSELVLGVSSSLNVGETERPDMAFVGESQFVGDVKRKDLAIRRVQWLLIVSRR